MANYRAFGLTFSSELELPGLPLTDAPADVTIRRGSIPEWQGEAITSHGGRFRIRDQQAMIRFPRMPFAAHITDGREIRFDAPPEADPLAALHLLGSCTGMILYQRGLVPIHGNAIATKAGTIIVAGNIGAGKSTTALALLERGSRLVADDISAIELVGGKPTVRPGFPRLKLWRATVEAFNIDPASLRKLRPELEKYHYPVEDRFCAESQPLRAIYILQPSNESGIRIRSLTGNERLMQIQPHLYKLRFPGIMKNWPQALVKICLIAGRVPIRIVERPRLGSSINEVAEAIELSIQERSADLG